jgi:F0F1-type ATP synthase assembly protein I
MKNDTNWVMFIILLTGFCLGFIVAQAIYDKRPITGEEYYESQKSEYYE